MSHLLQLVIELTLLTLLLGYKDVANNSFNDWFLLNPKLIQPSGKMVFKVGFVYSKGICFFNKLLRSRSLKTIQKCENYIYLNNSKNTKEQLKVE